MNEPPKTTLTEEAREAVKEIEQKIKELAEKRSMRRDPAGAHIALAFNATTVLHWCRIHGVNPKNLRIVTTMRDARGVGYDLIAICFPDWGANKNREFHQAVKLLEDKIIAYRYSDDSRPVVEKGRIIGWTPIKNQDTSSHEVSAISPPTPSAQTKIDPKNDADEDGPSTLVWLEESST